jgi:hypothetical protein
LPAFAEELAVWRQFLTLRVGGSFLVMNWINLQTLILRSEEYIGAEPLARATWLNVLGWCCEQENGGRIVGAYKWSDRRWQQTCGVTKDEVGTSSPLLRYDGEDLIVWSYPVDKQAEVQAKRQAGREGGLKSAASKAAISPEAKLQAQLQAQLKADAKQSVDGREGNGIGIGTEWNSIPPKPPLLGGGEQQTLPTDIPTNDPPPPQQHKNALQIRAEKLFSRGPTRQWVENEQRAWAKNRGAIEATTDEDWSALEAFYAFNDTSRHTVYRRRDLKTLINNWCSEIDKANEFRRNGPQLKPGAPYVANDGPATEGF